MPFGNVVLNGVAMAAVWLTVSGIGAMLGNFIAVVRRMPASERSDWTALGGAIGCAIGLLLTICALGVLTKL
jgi:hypothetical protein